MLRTPLPSHHYGMLTRASISLMQADAKNSSCRIGTVSANHRHVVV